jgi:hypothetical protein
MSDLKGEAGNRPSRSPNAQTDRQRTETVTPPMPAVAPRQATLPEQVEQTRAEFGALVVQAKAAADATKLAKIFVTTEVSPNRPPDAQ